MSRARFRRLVGLLTTALLLAAILLPPPASWIAFFAFLALGAAFRLLLMPTEVEMEVLAEQGKKSPGLMTAFEVGKASGIPWKKVPEVLRKDGVPRADRTGWRAWLPVVGTKIQYRRRDIEDWLGGSSPPN